MIATAQSISLLQSCLGKDAAGTPDGIMGPRTKRAITAFQEAVGSTPDGHLTDADYSAFTEMRLDDAGDPDYTTRLNGLGVPVVGHHSPGVVGKFVPIGVMIHHTGADDQDGDHSDNRMRIPPERMIDGRRGLRGPIVQFGVNRDKTIDCYTHGRAHHAGMGSKVVLDALRADTEPSWPIEDVISGNTYFIGIEVDHSGDPSEPMGDHWEVAARLAVELCEIWKWDPQRRVIGHLDWTARKSDPIFPMPFFSDLMRDAKDATNVVPSAGDYAVVGGRRYRLVPET